MPARLSVTGRSIRRRGICSMNIEVLVEICEIINIRNHGEGLAMICTWASRKATFGGFGFRAFKMWGYNSWNQIIYAKGQTTHQRLAYIADI